MLGDAIIAPPVSKDTSEKDEKHSTMDGMGVISSNSDSELADELPRSNLCDIDEQTLLKEDEIDADVCPGITNYSQAGKFRIIIVGDSGIGKTTLVKKFLSCPEILGTETVPSKAGTIEFSRGSTQMIARDFWSQGLTPSDPKANAEIAECSANDCNDKMDGNHERSHESLNNGQIGNCGEVRKELNYNLTFIDVPGFGMHVDAMNVIRPVIELLYVQYHQTNKYFNPNVKRLERFLMSPNGAHTHVDVCLFGLLHRVKGVDIEFMRHLSKVVNVIPLILKSDTLKKSEILELKLSALKLIKSNNFSVYTFGKSIDELISLTENGELGYVPFAISSISDVDDPLTSSKNVIYPSESSERDMQNTLISEFNILKSKMFLCYVNDLRYNNALKFVEWRERFHRSKGSQKSSPSFNPKGSLDKHHQDDQSNSSPDRYESVYEYQGRSGFTISTSPPLDDIADETKSRYQTSDHFKSPDNYCSRPVKNLYIDTHKQLDVGVQESAASIFPTPLDSKGKMHPHKYGNLNASLAPKVHSPLPKRSSFGNTLSPDGTLNPLPSKVDVKHSATHGKDELFEVLPSSALQQSSSQKTAPAISGETLSITTNPHYCSSAPSSPTKCKDSSLSPEHNLKDAYKMKRANIRHMGVMYSGSSPNLHQASNFTKPPSIVGKVFGKIKPRRS